MWSSLVLIAIGGISFRLGRMVVVDGDGAVGGISLELGHMVIVGGGGGRR